MRNKIVAEKKHSRVAVVSLDILQRELFCPVQKIHTSEVMPEEPLGFIA